MARQRSRLEPAATTACVLLTLRALAIGLGVIAGILGSGSGLGLGNHGSCVEMANGRVPVPQTGDNVVMGVRDGVRSGASAVRMCVDEPTVGQRVLEALTKLPTMLVLLGALLLAV